jgi:hypothetical protein
MFHRFHDVMHQLKDADTETLNLVLSLTHPYAIQIETLDELKKYYWMWASVAEEGLDKIRQRQFNYYQSNSEIDQILMRRAEQDYARQLDTLLQFTQFYVCHHYLGTKGFESVSLD